MDEATAARRSFRYFKELLRFSDPATLSTAFPRLSFGDFSDLFGGHLFEDEDRLRVKLKFFSRVEEPEELSDEAAENNGDGDAVATESHALLNVDTEDISDELIDDNAGLFKKVPVFLCVCSNAAASQGHWESEEEFRTRAEPKAKKQLTIHYVIPATFQLDGSLECPSPLAIPTFPRDALEPQAHDAARDVVGTFDDFRIAINELIVDREYEEFADYLEAALHVYRRVTGSALKLGQGYRLVVVTDQVSPMTKRLHATYNELGRVNTLPPILRRVFGEQTMDRRTLAGADLLRVRQDHVAMVDRNKDGRRQIHALDPSQRLALHRHVQLAGRPGLIAVNGPPGTGKTDMLRAIIANLWVTAAITKSLCPIIVACGATNQSVENVVSAFDGASEPYPDVAADAGIENRWIIGVTDYGFASPSNPKDKIGKFQLIEFPFREPMRIRNAMPKGHTPFRELRVGHKKDWDVLARDFIARYAAAMKDSQFKAGLGSVSDPTPLLQQVQLRLHGALTKNVNATNALRQRMLDAFARQEVSTVDACLASVNAPDFAVAEIKRAFSLTSETYESACENLLDVTTRPASFHLAARYWEAEWLLSEALDEGGHLDKLRRFSMLGPCIVSTLHSAPKIAGDPLPFGKIDLVIVDEAGQGAVELGVPALSFAHQAIVVGDLKQLSPIVQITDLLDEKLAKEAGLTSAWLSERRLNGSESSIMAFAAHASSFGEGTRDGLLLRNHYRCARTIIEFCRELMYNEDTPQRELEPRKEDYALVSFADDVPLDRRGKVFPIPPMAFVQCGSILDEPKRTESWQNDGEKRRIVEWIDTDGRKLLAWYQKNVDDNATLSDVVAIITPFRAQANVLREAMDALLGKGHGLTIGTVHTLQGAEKPVVLFSAVSKPLENGKDVFFDKDRGRLLNVAVSRARDAFILFGHSDLFFSESILSEGNDSRKPSELLGRYMAGLCMSEHGGSRGTKILPRAVVIVESDHKAREIELMLPKEFQVFGTGGHIRDIGFGSIDARKDFSPPWELKNGALERLKLIGTRLLQTPHLIIATDPDEQGEAIGWHVLQVLKKHPNFQRYVRTVSRVLFTEIETSAIRTSFSRPLEVVDCDRDAPESALAMNFVHAALAQRVVDSIAAGYLRDRHDIISGRVRAPLVRLVAGATSEDERHEANAEVSVIFGKRSIPARIVSDAGAGSAAFFNGTPTSYAIEYLEAESSSELDLGPPTGLSTLDVLRAAFLRFGMLPGRTMAALLRLYEDRTRGEETDRSIPLSSGQGVAVHLFDGHLRPTDVGRDVANLLRKKESYISSLDFARDLENHLEDIRRFNASYKECVETWSQNITGVTASALPPEGPLQESPFVYPDLPASKSLTNATTDLFDVLSPLVAESNESADIEEERGLNVHPSLSPLELPKAIDTSVDLDELPDHLKVHAILVGRQIASAMCPARLRITAHAFSVSGLPVGSKLLIESYDVEEDGWLLGDAGARRELDAQFVRSEELVSLCSEKPVLRLTGLHPPEGLASSRVDRVLDFMAERDIGRPSTYASHIDALLEKNSYSSRSRFSSSEENEGATNQSESFASRSMSI